MISDDKIAEWDPQVQSQIRAEIAQLEQFGYSPEYLLLGRTGKVLYNTEAESDAIQRRVLGGGQSQAHLEEKRPDASVDTERGPDHRTVSLWRRIRSLFS
jgi:hypothetical protein